MNERRRVALLVLGAALVAIALIGFFGGCALHSAVVESNEDASAFSLWTTRGRVVGELASRYCLAGSERTRGWMRDAVQNSSTPAKVAILCPPVP